MTPAILTLVVACFFLSGATGLVYEVLWIRMLGLVFGHTVFAVTTVLTAFMAGLGLGSWAFGRLADRRARPLRLYGFLELGVGMLCLAEEHPLVCSAGARRPPSHARRKRGSHPSVAVAATGGGGPPADASGRGSGSTARGPTRPRPW